MEDIPRDIICHNTIKIEGRDKTSLDIAFSHKAVLLRISENLQENRELRYKQYTNITLPNDQ